MQIRDGNRVTAAEARDDGLDGHLILLWQYIGCDRAAECGVTEDRVINTSPVGMLLGWSTSRR
jgi:hypothetical protein